MKNVKISRPGRPERRRHCERCCTTAQLFEAPDLSTSPQEPDSRLRPYLRPSQAGREFQNMCKAQDLTDEAWPVWTLAGRMCRRGMTLGS